MTTATHDVGAWVDCVACNLGAPKDEHATLNEMVPHYALCALWSSCDDNGEPFDSEPYTDNAFSAEADEQMRADCAAFLLAARDILARVSITPAQLGHDLWLTRNGHGAGFWDRGLDEAGDALSDLAHKLGETSIYLSDRGELELEQ